MNRKYNILVSSVYISEKLRVLEIFFYHNLPYIPSHMF